MCSYIDKPESNVDVQ
uniref:Uncharacterized protein n=1 Tax=Anguilla anguilla TaxID=7936 RepID=A0A0E9RM16_ANGAN